MDRSHFRRASSPNLDARDLARLAKLEPSMQAQYRAQKAAKASSSLRSSDFAVPVSRTPTRSKDKREKRSKGDLLTHLMSMLTPSEEVKALNEIRMVVASEQQSAQRDELAEDQVVAESPLSSSADGSVSPSRSPSPASGSCAAAPSSATTSPTAAAGAAASTATTPTGSGGSIPRSESDPHLATHIAGLLLAHGDDSRTADMKISDHLNSTLCFAASTGNLLVAKRALMYGAHIDGVNYDQRTPLHLASAHGYLPMAQFLVEQGADVHAVDGNGFSPIHDALLNKHYDVVFFLISAGAKVERSDEMEDICRALILAAFRGDLVNLRQLYLAQIDMNYQDYNKRTALHVSASEGHLEVVQFLVSEAHVQLNLVDRFGGTALDDAVRHGYAHVADFLRSNGAVSGKLVAPDGSILEGESVEDMELATDTPAEDEEDALECMTRICNAIVRHDADAVRQYLQSSTNPSLAARACDYDGRTALHVAATVGDLEACKILIDAGADWESHDHWGVIPIQDALRGGHDEIVAYLTDLAMHGDTFEACPLDDFTEPAASDCSGELELSSNDTECCKRLGSHRNNFHGAFGELLRQIRVAGDWSIVEAWVPQPDGQSLRCCSECCSLEHEDLSMSRPNLLSSDERHARLWSWRMSRDLTSESNKRFQSVRSFYQASLHYLIELNFSLVSGSNPMGDFSVIWCDHLDSLSQARFPRAPHARESGFKTGMKISLSWKKQTIAVVMAFSRDRIQENRKVVTLAHEFANRTLELLLSQCRLSAKINALPARDFSDKLFAMIDAPSESPYCAMSIAHAAGALDMILSWASAMDSEENRAAMIVLSRWCQAILERLQSSGSDSSALPSWANVATRERIALVLRFLVTVSPVVGPKAPLVRNQAKELLDKFEAASVVEKKLPPFFGPTSGIESPIRAAIRQFMRAAEREFAQHPQRSALDRCKLRSLHEAIPGADVYNTLGSHEGNTGDTGSGGGSFGGGGGGGGGGSRGYYGSPSSLQQYQISRMVGVGFGGRGYWGSSRTKLVTEEESALVSRLCGDFVATARKANDRFAWFSIENILKLHSSLQLEATIPRGAFRKTVAVGSHQFYTFYRVFMPHEEVPDAMAELVATLNSEQWRSAHPVLVAFVVFAVLVYYIHPFQDGNGRTSRMLANLIVWLTGLPMILSHTDKIITLSEFVRRAAAKVPAA